MFRRATIVAPSVLIVLACACSPAVDTTDQPPKSHWTPAGTDQLLDLAALEGLAPPSKVDASGASLEQWKLQDLNVRPAGSGLEVTASGQRPRAVVAVDLDGDAIRSLELMADGLDAGRVSLFWAAAGESFGPDRVVHQQSKGTADSGRIRFDLDQLATWRGRIARLRLDLPLPEAGSATLYGLDVTPVEDLLAQLTDRSWAISFGRELRSAMLVTPSVPLHRQLDAGRGATTISFAYGLLPDTGCAATLAVTAPAVEDPTRQTLFSHRIPAEKAGTWLQSEFDAPSRVAGAALEITVTTEKQCSSSRVAVAVGTVRTSSAKRDPRPSIVFISIDTLRPDHLGLHGYGRNTSPTLDAWATDHAVVFEDAWANASWTLPSHASMLTGQTALRHGVNSLYPAPSSLLTVAERLREAGYQTAAWTGGSWLSPKYGLYQGFDEFRWWTTPDGGKNELSSQVAEIATWLETERGTPLFLFVHTYEVHSPYRARSPYFESFTDAEPLAPVTDRLLQPFRDGGYLLRKRLEFADGEPVAEADYPRVEAAYDSGIAYADAQLDRLLEAIEQQLGDNVVVLLTSDHGEALGEEGRVSHGRLEDEDLRIPWLLRLPGDRAAGTRVGARVSSVDMVPTVLELAGITPQETLDGESVLALIDGAGRRTPTRPAVESYAASSNLGLSLRLRDGGAFIFNDTPWAPLAERERWTGLRSEDPALLDRLRSEVEERLTAATGLHLLAWNGDSEALEIDLKGPCVHPLTVKLTAPDDPEIVWVRPKHAHWTVPAGADMRIRFDTPVAPCVSVEVSNPGSTTGQTFRLDIDPRDPAAGWLAGRIDGTWQVLAPGTTPTTGLSAWLTGPVDATFTDPTDGDAELMEQLRTLGYLQ